MSGTIKYHLDFGINQMDQIRQNAFLSEEKMHTFTRTMRELRSLPNITTSGKRFLSFILSVLYANKPFSIRKASITPFCCIVNRTNLIGFQIESDGLINSMIQFLYYIDKSFVGFTITNIDIS